MVQCTLTQYVCVSVCLSVYGTDSHSACTGKQGLKLWFVYTKKWGFAHNIIIFYACKRCRLWGCNILNPHIQPLQMSPLRHHTPTNRNTHKGYQLTFEPIGVDFRYEISGDVTGHEARLCDDVSQHWDIVIHTCTV